MRRILNLIRATLLSLLTSSRGPCIKLSSAFSFDQTACAADHAHRFLPSPRCSWLLGNPGDPRPVGSRTTCLGAVSRGGIGGNATCFGGLRPHCGTQSPLMLDLTGDFAFTLVTLSERLDVAEILQLDSDFDISGVSRREPFWRVPIGLSSLHQQGNSQASRHGLPSIFQRPGLPQLGAGAADLRKRTFVLALDALRHPAHLIGPMTQTGERSVSMADQKGNHQPPTFEGRRQISRCHEVLAPSAWGRKSQSRGQL